MFRCLQKAVTGMHAAVLVFIAGCAASVDHTSVSERYLQAALEAGYWLQDQGDMQWAGAIPDEIGRDSAFSAGLGSGAAGRVVFFLELFEASGDSTFLRSAESEGDAVVRLTEGAAGSAGLYNGLSGAAFALTELSKRSSVFDYRAAAEERFEAVAAAGGSDGGSMRWGNSNDVLVGTAGIGLALLYAARELDRPALLAAARAAGAGLVDEAEVMPVGVRWHRFTDRELDLPNFSHGTAGVAYFLAELGQATGEPQFMTAAEEGAAYLVSVADTSDGLFLIPYGIPNEGYSTNFDIGWAHGPAGSARLFYKLWLLTGGERYRDIVEASARAVPAAGVPGPSTDTLRWAGPFGIDRRFGMAGIVPFLVDWHNASGDAANLDRAQEITDTILSEATATNRGIYWTIPRFGFQGEGNATFTGYFYGSAGLVMALLEMHHGAAGSSPSIRFPDDPFGSPVGRPVGP